MILEFNNPISEKVWEDRYRKEGESVSDHLWRVAKYIYPNNKVQAQNLYDAMNQGCFILGGRVMANAGIGQTLTLNNCFTSNRIEDSIEDIFQHVKWGALVHQKGGGIGYAISTIRPKGDRTSNDGIASGPVSFLHVFNAQTSIIQQGSRRGANMAIMDIYHPDIFEYIDAKQNDPKNLEYFNMSVMIDDDFMKAVEKDEQIALRFPVYDEDGHILPVHSSQTVIYKWVSAKQLWDKITQNAYNTGEPGVFFRDNIERVNPLKEWESAVVTNPCVTGDTLILTDRGEFPIEELVDKEVTIWNGFEWSEVIPIITGYNQPILKITVGFGENQRENVIQCTPYHKFVLQNGDRVEAKDLEIGQFLLPYQLVDEEGLRYHCTAYIEDIQELHTTANKVYCLNEPKNHTFIANGVITGNCGEFIGSIVHRNKQIQGKEYGGSCNLGSLYLHNFVGKPFTTQSYIQFPKLRETIQVAVRALDDVIDINHYPLPMYENYQKHFRTIGLGVTGLADMLVMLGLDYRTEEARHQVAKVMDFITYWAYQTSVDLAREKGPAPCLSSPEALELYAKNGFLQHMIDLHEQKGDPTWKNLQESLITHGIRNTKLMSIAPVGTGSLVWGNNCSSGIEPIFSLEYKRKIKIGGQDDSNQQEVILKDYAWNQFTKLYDFSSKLYNAYRKNFVTALEMTPEEHVEMLGVIAQYVDMSVSKTINIPTDYSFEQTKDIYLKCYELGIKGCTIFRPNEIRQGILEAPAKEEPSTTTKTLNELQWGDALLDSDTDIGKRRKLMTGCGSLHCTAWFDPDTGNLISTYLNKGSTGGCNNFMIGLSRLISAAAKRGMTIDDIVDQCESCGSCPSYTARTALYHDTSKGSSCPVAVGYALKSMWEEFQEETGLIGTVEPTAFDKLTEENKVDFNKENKEIPTPIIKHKFTNPICPECGEELTIEGGCNVCKSCGYSKCG